MHSTTSRHTLHTAAPKCAPSSTKIRHQQYAKTPPVPALPPHPSSRVIAAGKSANQTLGYDWAVVSGGPPSVPTLRGKCRTGDVIHTPLDVKGDGLWLFTRNPIDPAGAQAALDAADTLGFDTKLLKPVMQRGCLFGAPPTPAPPLIPGGILNVPAASTIKAAAATSAMSKANAMTNAVTNAKAAASSGSKQSVATGAGGAKAATGIKLESAPVPAAAAGGSGGASPKVTRKIYFNLEQAGKPLGRVVLGL